MTHQLNDFLNFSIELADEARLISLKYFKKKISIKSKEVNKFDPVSIADIKIQKKINHLIENKFNEHSILGEEESFIKNSLYEWCIDPIDGTKSYIQGVPLWGTLISLARNGKTILGLVDIPALDERYIGYKKKAYKISKGKKTKLKTKKNFKLSNSILNQPSNEYHFT